MLDEAYVEFAEPGLPCSLAEWLGELPCRAIGYRTFSKFFGLSGFRIGWRCRSGSRPLRSLLRSR
jgi:histidinol-phosphate/aromatic aminotransferase/cobyric acid decarboxylase-like protein